MEISVESVRPLRFGDGRPVRSASGVAALGGGLLVVQDDANHAAWWRGHEVGPVRLFPAREGRDVFGEATGTKHLKPDLEAACSIGPGDGAVLLLGSGSSPERTRCAVVRVRGGGHEVLVADLAPVHDAAASALGLARDDLNVEGACVVGESLRCFQRGLPGAGVPSASVDLRLDDVLAVLEGDLDPAAVAVADAATYDLGEVGGVGLAVTDAVALGEVVLVSAAAEDTDDPRDDGRVTGSVLARLEGGVVVDAAPVAEVGGRVCKIEGLAVLDAGAGGARLVAVVDADDPAEPSLALRLRVTW